ncbi:hypothetical protein ASC80_10905 [Afipia sp. Root123D2]|uniref:Uncharacterized protein n=1 Tax=Afipia massiliensis TaxID=211460 RepID=A0A840N9Y3_9BRAD|nr:MULTISPECIES: hypothetical protein [Afipia]KQW20716.1 hypothetical protein ASC80_10905 [Afipia sp. Root123D2]MBB5053516.1 hypothetical protein [Afipia massiliensis]MBS4001882.1 hypothetical protein [Afipia sp.]
MHKLAKEIVATKCRLNLPEVRAEFNGEVVVLHKAGLVRFDSAVVEAQHLKTIVPDLYAQRAGHRLLVEIYVTHACDELKRIELKNQGIAAIEIDLSRLLRNSSRSDVEEAVLEKAGRHWLFHPKIDAEVEAMRTRHQAKLDVQRLRFEKEVTDCLQRYDAGLKELASRKVEPSDEDAEFFRIGLGAHIGCPVGGAGGFRVTEREWQFALLRTFLPKDAERSSYRHKALFDWLKKQKFTRADFDYIRPELEDAARGRNDQFRSPYRAVEAYLDKLVERGILQKHRSYWLSKSVFDGLLDLRASDQRKASRRTNLTGRIERILASLPDQESGDLTADEWLKLPQDGGLSFDAAIEADDGTFDEMVAPLHKIEAMMFRNGMSVLQALRLPIEREQERQVNARKLEAEAKGLAKAESLRLAMDGRRQRIQSTASAHGGEWTLWIQTAHLFLNGKTPLEAAIEGEDGMNHALALLRDAVDKRARERSKAEEIHRWRITLEREVFTILGSAAQPFLNSPYSLGPNGRKFRPRDHCVSEATFRECVDLAKEVLKKRR